MSKPNEREALDSIAPYKPAKTIESVCRKYGLKSIVKLAGNENRLGCSPQVISALENFQGEFSYYPDTNYTRLREILTRKHNVNDAQLIFGNGSFELISLAAQTYLEKGDEAIISESTFGWYTNATLQMDATPVYVPLKDFGINLEAMKETITDKTKIIWICNPNNPTGTVIPETELLSFIDSVPENILIVLDEAYIDFIEGGYIDTVDIIRKHKNVLLLRTFSKLYGLAAFRIGYGIADEEILSCLHKVRLPINVNFAAYAAAVASLEDVEFKEKVLKHNRNSLDFYYRELDNLGLKYVRSNCNFIIVETGIDGGYVEEEFLKRGYMIRNGEEFGLKNYVRISIGTEEENAEVIKILKDILKGES